MSNTTIARDELSGRQKELIRAEVEFMTEETFAEMVEAGRVANEHVTVSPVVMRKCLIAALRKLAASEATA